jgi:hypothetical protein
MDTSYSCAYKANKIIFYFQSEQCTKTVLQLGASLLQMAYADFWIFLAKTLPPLRILSRYEKVFRSIICIDFVSTCFLFFVFILSHCADSVIGSCSCWVSTLK